VRRLKTAISAVLSRGVLETKAADNTVPSYISSASTQNRGDKDLISSKMGSRTRSSLTGFDLSIITRKLEGKT